MDSTPPQKDMTHQEEDIRVEDANPPPPTTDNPKLPQVPSDAQSAAASQQQQYSQLEQGTTSMLEDAVHYVTTTQG